MQGNFEISIFIAISFLLFLGVRNFYIGIQSKNSMNSLVGKFMRENGAEWIALYCEDSESATPVTLLIHREKTNTFKIKKILSPSLVEMGAISSIKIKEKRPHEIIQPNAAIEFDFIQSQKSFNVSGSKNWAILGRLFPGFDGQIN